MNQKDFLRKRSFVKRAKMKKFKDNLKEKKEEKLKIDKSLVWDEKEDIGLRDHVEKELKEAATEVKNKMQKKEKDTEKKDVKRNNGKYVD